MKEKIAYPPISVISKKHRGTERLCLIFKYHTDLIAAVRKLPIGNIVNKFAGNYPGFNWKVEDGLLRIALPQVVD